MDYRNFSISCLLSVKYNANFNIMTKYMGCVLALLTSTVIQKWDNLDLVEFKII